MSISKRNVDVEADLELYYQNDSSKPYEISRRDINKISCELSSDSEESIHSLDSLDYRGLRKGRTREKLETAQRERRQGKSTLCNVLVNKDNEFKETFKNRGYEVKSSEVILAIAESIKKIENGLNQIFVVAQKLTDKEVKVYKILNEVLFDERITDYITIVRTNFNEFDQSSCDK
ncbi:14703_t:CDS:2, partial [Cetraspora pellucida]